MSTELLNLQQNNQIPLVKPNLPEGEVCTVAISSKATEAISYFNKVGIECIEINENPNLPKALNCHADLSLINYESGKIICSEHLYAGQLADYYEISSERSIGHEYPVDVPLNCVVVGNKVICNEKTVSKLLLEYFYKSGKTIINVKQGYSKCSVCILTENSIITDDSGIFKSSQNFFDDVTLIEKASIRLPGYDYGFIGGTCGKISADRIAFNGEIISHKDHNLIIEACNRNNINIVEVKNGPLTDIGSILPLREKA